MPASNELLVATSIRAYVRSLSSVGSGVGFKVSRLFKLPQAANKRANQK